MNLTRIDNTILKNVTFVECFELGDGFQERKYISYLIGKRINVISLEEVCSICAVRLPKVTSEDTPESKVVKSPQ